MPSPLADHSPAAESDACPRLLGTRLTPEMQEKMKTARAQLGTSSVAILVRATGAARSNVRAWLQNRGRVVTLGRPRFFSSQEEETMAFYFA